MAVFKSTRRNDNTLHNVIVEKSAPKKDSGVLGHIVAILRDDVVGLFRHASSALQQAEQLTAYSDCMHSRVCSDEIESKRNYLPPIYDEVYSGSATSPTPGMATVNAVVDTLKESADLISTSSKVEAYANRNTTAHGKDAYEAKPPFVTGVDNELKKRAQVVEEIVG